MSLMRRLVRINDRSRLLRRAPENVRLGVLVAELVIGASLSIFVVVTLIRAAISLSVPSDAGDILKSVGTPEAYVAEIESVRVKDGEESHQVRIVGVAGTERFQAQMVRVFPGAQEVLMASDGDATIIKRDDAPAEMLETPIDPATVAVPYAPDIAEASPAVVDEEATARAVQAWEISFELTPRIIRGLFLADALAITGPEQDAILAGDYTTDWAYVLVTRRERALVALDARFTLSDGTTYRFLVKYRTIDASEIAPPVDEETDGEATPDDPTDTVAPATSGSVQ